MRAGKVIQKKFNNIEIYHYNFPEEKFDFHQHSRAQIIIPLIGHSHLYFNHEKSDKAELNPGKIGVIPPHVEHCFMARNGRDKNGERLVCYFEEKTWEKYFDKKIKAGVFHLNPLLKEMIFYLLLVEKSEHSDEIVKTFLLILNESLVTAEWEDINFNVDDIKIKKAINYIEKHFKEKISMQDLSKECGLGQRDLNRKFLKLARVTPKKLQTHLRIDYAKKILKSKKMSVTEVAFEVGYQSVSQFIKAFREETGKLPTEYKI